MEPGHLPIPPEEPALLSLPSLDPDLVNEYRDRRNGQTWEPLGRHLVGLGALTDAQLMELLEDQLAAPHRRLGDLAVEAGYCSPEQVEEAIRAQRAASIGPPDLALRRGPDSQDHAFGPVLDYTRFLEAKLYRLEATVSHDPAARGCPTHRYLVETIDAFLRGSDQPERLRQDFHEDIGRKAFLPLGRILLDRKILGVRQLMGLLNIQLNEPDRLLGELAVREEYCSADDIEEALRVQSKRAPCLASFLDAHPYVTASTARDLLTDYAAFLERRIRSLDAVAA